MNELNSVDLLNQLIAKLEEEIDKDQKAIDEAGFALKVKKARLKKLKSEPKTKE